MLRIIQNKAAGSAKSYYSHGDYLSEGQELAGRWGGKLADQLGLSGLVNKADFDALCDNLHPQTAKRLSQRMKDDRTVGYDFNFHVPKGVSVAYALNQDERIVEKLRESVNETMQDVEADAQTRVRKQGKQLDRTTGNLVWAEFVHTTARPVNGVPDPHLHVHAFCFNQTYDSEEGVYKAAQFKRLKQDAPYYEALFHARLADKLKQLGYAIERKERSWDIGGVAASITKKFSRRTDQIEELAREQGIMNGDAKDQLGAKSREKKQSSLTMPELRTLWRERLTSNEGNSLHVLKQSLSTPTPAFNEFAPMQAVKHAISHCFEREAVLPKRTVLAEALKRGVGETAARQVLDAFEGEPMITREIGGRMMVTTRAVLEEERQVLKFARDGKHACLPLNSHWQLTRDWLSAEQKSAITQLITSNARVQILQGGAGTGKTTLLQEMVAAIEAGGKQVLAFAPSAQASRKVLRDEGFAAATTVAELLVNKSLQKQLAGNVILIDEAGLLSTKQMKQVFDLAQQYNSRVILSGDHRQHASVARGGLLTLLERQAGIRPATVNTIQRQRGAYKQAVEDLALGHLLNGFDKLDALGWVREIGDGDREQTLAREYADARQKRESVLVVSPMHREADKITQAIRSELQARQLLKNQETQLTTLKPLHRTLAERQDAGSYSPGEVIVFHQNAAGHKKGERIVVDEQINPTLLKQADRFNVFRQATLQVSVGDNLRITAGGLTDDKRHRLNNGAVYALKQFTPEGNLVLDNGWVVSKNFGHLDYGYVSTSHSSQGRTVDRVLIAESSQSFDGASREQFYVSASRARKQAVIFTDEKLALREAIQASSQALTATEFARGKNKATEHRRNKRALEAILAARQQVPENSPQADKQKSYERLYG